MLALLEATGLGSAAVAAALDGDLVFMLLADEVRAAGADVHLDLLPLDQDPLGMAHAVILDVTGLTDSQWKKVLRRLAKVAVQVHPEQSV